MALDRSIELSDVGQSDSEDWTLVSRPNSLSSSSHSSSPENQQPVDIPNQDELTDDGLMEINLRDEPKELEQVRSIQEVERNNSPELVMSGFQAVESTCVNDDQSSSPVSSRKSSLSQSELSDYVDLGKQENVELANREKLGCTRYQSKPEPVNESAREASADRSSSEIECSNIKLRQKMDELSGVARSLMATRQIRELDQISQAHSQRPITRQWLVLHLIVVLIHVGINHLLINHRETSNVNPAHTQQFQLDGTHESPLERLYRRTSESPVTASQEELRLELRLIQDELSECIKRQSPTSYKYYLSDARDNQESFKNSQGTTVRPFKGLVCYGQESHWRKRFEKIRHGFNLDLKKLINDARRKVTNEMLEIYHPALQLKLILNQIEYLDFLESKRKAKQYDETIKYLKGENLRLIRSLSDRGRPSEASSHKKHIRSLEAENNKLRRQIDTLTTSLSMKAGPTYMKQSLELEHYEQENDVLKKFNLELARDISSNLKLFQQHTIDAFETIDDQKSLHTQISLTRTYMFRLKDKISSMLSENEELKAELKDVTNELLVISAPDTSAVASSPYQSDQSKRVVLRPSTLLGFVQDEDNLESFCSTKNLGAFSQYNSSGALMNSNCAHDLKETRAELSFVLGQLDRLRRECNDKLMHESDMSSSLSKQASPHLSNLSRVKETNSLSRSESKSMAITNGGLSRRVADLIDETASNELDLNNENRLVWKSVLIDAIVFLEKFNELDTLEPAILGQELRLFADKIKARPARLHDVLEASKVLPNYIREATREKRVVSTTTSPLVELPTQQSYLASSLVNTSFTLPQIRTKMLEKENSLLRATGKILNLISQPTDTENAYATSQPPDSWFFKRAKQRRQLRCQPEIGESVGQSAEWIHERDRQRESLSKLPAHMKNNYRTRDSFIKSQAEYMHNRENSLSSCKQERQEDVPASCKPQPYSMSTDEEASVVDRNWKTRQQRLKKKRKGKQRDGQRRKHGKCKS